MKELWHIEKSSAKEILDILLSTGGEYAEVFMEDSSSELFEMTLGKMSQATYSSVRGAAIRIIKDGTDIHTAYRNLRIIDQELPELSVHISTYSDEEQIQIRVMGRIQLEILQSLVKERFGLDIDFGPCRILYKETVENPVMGYGHYEPLRHYAETQLRIEPAERNSGITVLNECSIEVLDSNFQNLILTHIKEKEHLGILTGSPLTDVKIILTAGRSHLKHTEGGDFREATYRAIRQGLEKADNVEFIWNSTADEFVFDNGFKGIEIKNTHTGATEELTLDGLFIAIGLILLFDFFKAFAKSFKIYSCCGVAIGFHCMCGGGIYSG